MAKKRSKQNKSKSSRTIQSIKCERCNGTGYRARVVDSVLVGDAIAELLKIHSKAGCQLPGGIDFEVCYGGEDRTIPGLQQSLTQDDFDGLASRFVVSYWTCAHGDNKWVTDSNLEQMLKTRLEQSLQPRQKMPTCV